jgi:hypothetical protein
MPGAANPSLASVRSCGLIRRFAIAGLLACVLAQLLIEATARNLLCVALSAVMSAAVFQIVVRPTCVRSAPLPTLVVLGFNVATMSGALIAQTLSLRPLVFNLQVPQITFVACALFQLSLLAALLMFVYSFPLPFRSASQIINVRVFRPMGLMDAPRTAQLWLMGIIGVVAMAWTSTVANTDAVQYGDVGAKFADGLTYFAYAPFLIPVLPSAFPLHTAHYRYRPRLLFAYSLVLVVLGVALNSRGRFAVGIANLGIAVPLLSLLGQLPMTGALRRRLLVFGMLALLATPILSDLATAMVVVRVDRGQVSAPDLVARTFGAFFDKRALEDYRAAAAISTGKGDYEEFYLSNPFLSRFVQTKFFDNTLALEAVREGRYSAELWAITLDRIVAQLPTPVLRLIGSKLDKGELAYSIGDALIDPEYHTGLGAYLTGSPIAHGLALMGPLVYVVAIALFVIVFMVLQMITTSFRAGMVVLSPVALLQLMPIFQLASLDSLLDPLLFLLRTLPQDILIYWLLFRVTGLLTSFPRRRPAAAAVLPVPPGGAFIGRMSHLRP